MLKQFSDALTKARKTSAMKIKKERTLIPLKKVNVLFFSVLRDSIAFWKSPRLRPYGLLARVTWRICGMMLTVKSELLGESSISLSVCPPQVSHGLNLHRFRTPE
jgi:hypothetical protein